MFCYQVILALYRNVIKELVLESVPHNMAPFNWCVRSFPIGEIMTLGKRATFRPLSMYIYCTKIENVFRPQHLLSRSVRIIFN